MVTPRQIAAYFVRLAGDEVEPVPLTHLHLQKLLYYAQGWSLGLRGRPIFEESVRAWQHGPVVSELYQQLKSFGERPVELPACEADAIDANDKFLILAVWQKYKVCSALQLRAQTHQEAPWADARHGLRADAPSDVEITRASLQQFFAQQIDRAQSPATTQVDWTRRMANGEPPDPQFLEALQSVFITDRELLKRLAS